MTAMPAALKARVTEDCKAATTKLTTPRPWQPKAPKPKTESTSPHVRAFRHLSQDIENKVAKCRDLQQQPGAVRSRHFISKDTERARKYSIETGWDENAGAYRLAPLEPWTGPSGSQKLYQRIMTASEPLTLASLTAAELESAVWMRDEGLAGVDDNGHVRPLSDPDAGKHRTYPGAKVSDKKAAIGHQLRDRAFGIVLAAMFNLTSGNATARGLRGKLSRLGRKGGMMLPAIIVTTESNAIKGKRRDLDEYRHLSVSVVRKVLKILLGRGVLEEIEPPRAVRRQRSWRVIPRVFAAVADIITGKREQDE